MGPILAWSQLLKMDFYGIPASHILQSRWLGRRGRFFVWLLLERLLLLLCGSIHYVLVITPLHCHLQIGRDAHHWNGLMVHSLLLTGQVEQALPHPQCVGYDVVPHTLHPGGRTGLMVLMTYSANALTGCVQPPNNSPSAVDASSVQNYKIETIQIQASEHLAKMSPPDLVK